MPNIWSNLSVYPISSQLSFQLGFIIFLQMRNGGTHEKLTWFGRAPTYSQEEVEVLNIGPWAQGSFPILRCDRWSQKGVKNSAFTLVQWFKGAGEVWLVRLLPSSVYLHIWSLFWNRTMDRVIFLRLWWATVDIVCDSVDMLQNLMRWFETSMLGYFVSEAVGAGGLQSLALLASAFQVGHSSCYWVLCVCHGLGIRPVFSHLIFPTTLGLAWWPSARTVPGTVNTNKTSAEFLMSQRGNHGPQTSTCPSSSRQYLDR